MKENKEELITIIVPIYNVANYLVRCVNSILNQTYRNLEIILVDDGSTDDSGKIADDIKNSDKRINVIHKKNGGLSDARNAGIDIARGRYLIFIDSDDEINENFVSTLYRDLVKNDADMSMCYYQKVQTPEQITPSDNMEDVEVFDGKLIENLFGKNTLIITVAWNKIYKAELFNGLRYPVGKIHEDEYLVHHLLMKSKRITINRAALYYYYKRLGSITSTFNLKRLDAMDAFKERIEILKEDNKLKKYAVASYMTYLALTYSSMGKYKKERDVILKELKMQYKIYTADNMLLMSEKIKAILKRYFPRLYSFLKLNFSL